ncbi:hypothetical protein [Bdellovibrio sp. HCB337]|uniref:hypothetical protein n=1 Tax=Bdellovibrio sp. HCB337 TaxID=3394358 RepID=UPI0039A75F4B
MNPKLKGQILLVTIISQMLALPGSFIVTVTEYFHISFSRSLRPRTFAQMDTFGDVASFWFRWWLIFTIVGLLLCWASSKKKNP